MQSPSVAENTRCNSQRTAVLEKKLSTYFRPQVSSTNSPTEDKVCPCSWSRQWKDRVLLPVRACGGSPVPLAMTHMRWSLD